MRDCDYFEQLCSVSVDGTLTEEERRELSEHVKGCPSCAALLSDLEQMRTMLREEPAYPASLHGNIMERLSGEARLTVVQPVKPARHMPVFTMVAAAAVVVLVVLGGGVGQLFGTKGAGNPAGATIAEAAAQTASGEAKSAPPTENAAPPTENAAPPTEDTVTAAAPETRNSASESGGAENGAFVPAPQPAEPQPAEPEPAAAEEAPAAATPEPKQETAGTDGAAAPRAVAFGAPVPETEAADTGAGTLPEGISGMAVAHSYIAVGSAELPELDGTLLLENGEYSYFSLSNNMTVLEKTLDSVEKAGYAVSDYENVGLVSDSKAESWLLIVKRSD